MSIMLIITHVYINLEDDRADYQQVTWNVGTTLLQATRNMDTMMLQATRNMDTVMLQTTRNMCMKVPQATENISTRIPQATNKMCTILSRVTMHVCTRRLVDDEEAGSDKRVIVTSAQRFALGLGVDSYCVI